ncbi:MAG: glycosyltransferase family 2 protein [Chloroflexi bacterium]|nr:glycosyltransferase family 2 protein [Chloroflexota bacterium]
MSDVQPMEISVVIPVYNAAAFLVQAVESALAQQETAEVVLVEDGSTDASLAICQQLASDPRVKLYRHADSGHQGVSASRNLGILSSRYPFVAFLDADDYYLPERFRTARQLFDDDPSIDGVYEAIGTHLEDEFALHRWLDQGYHEAQLTTMNAPYAPDVLFERLVGRVDGNFSIIGLVVKRELFARTGLFPPHLGVGEDAVMKWKLAAVGRLMGGQLAEPIAKSRVHGQNSYTGRAIGVSQLIRQRLATWEAFWRWAQANLSRVQRQLFVRGSKKYLSDRLVTRNLCRKLAYSLLVRAMLAYLLFKFPELGSYSAFWKHYLPDSRKVGYRRIRQWFQKDHCLR